MTSSALSDDGQIRSLLDTYWSEWTQALADPDPERASLTSLLTGQARDSVIQELTTSRALNEIAIRAESGPMPHKTLSVEVNGDSARVRECVVDDTITVDRSTQSTIDARVDGLILSRSLVRSNGHWIVVSNERVGSLDKGETCDNR